MKRSFDVVVSLAVLALLSPLLLVVVALVRITLGSPVFFTQDRPGLNGRIFRLLKFRTMRTDKGPDGRLLPDDQRLTNVGRFLRSTSIDELPELWNVVRGEMSLVGPRPLLVSYLKRYSREQSRRHEVRPGVTGWAQVNGRNAVDWEERFRLDVWYVDHRSFILDLRILWLTVSTVLRREGISGANTETMKEFSGKEAEGEKGRDQVRTEI